MRTWLRGMAILLVGMSAMCCSHTSSKIQLENVEGTSMRVIERARSYYPDFPLEEADEFEAVFQATEAEVNSFRAKGEPLWLIHDELVLEDRALDDLRLRVYLRDTAVLRRLVVNRSK